MSFYKPEQEPADLLPIPPQRPTPDWILAMPKGLERDVWLKRQEDNHRAYWLGPIGQARLRALVNIDHGRKVEAVRVTLADGDHWCTTFHGTAWEAVGYFMGRRFEAWNDAKGCEYTRAPVVSVELIA